MENQNQQRMKLFQSALNYFSMLGIRSNQSFANVNLFIAEIIFITQVSADCVFIIFEAKTFRQYTYILFFMSTTVMAVACFTIFATKRVHLFQMIDITEEIVEKSEWSLWFNFQLHNDVQNVDSLGSENPTRRAMYMETNRIIEKWSQIAFYFITTVTPVGFIFPKTIIVYWIYFTTDFENDAFDLPFDTW